MQEKFYCPDCGEELGCGDGRRNLKESFFCNKCKKIFTGEASLRKSILIYSTRGFFSEKSFQEKGVHIF